MEKEKREELSEAAKSGNLVQQVVDSKGWTEVIRPCLEAKKVQYLEQFRDVKEHTDFMLCQQSVNAIDWLISYVEVILVQGKEAIEELRKNP